MVNRIFKANNRHGELVEFELKAPGLTEENEGERNYRIAYSKSLTEGIFPRQKLREVMSEHGMWTDEDERQMKKVVGKIAVLQIELARLEKEGKKDQCVSVAKEIAENRRRMWELFMVQQSVYMNSAEGIAELVKTESIMAACVIVKSTGKRYWQNYAEYVIERDSNVDSTVYSKALEIQTSLFDETRQKITEDYPEVKYGSAIKDPIVDPELEKEVLEEIRKRAEIALAKENSEPVEEKPQVKNVRKKPKNKAD